MADATVSKDMHDGRCKLEDERFARDLCRIESLEEGHTILTKISIELSEISKQNKDIISDLTVRIKAIEGKPAKLVTAATIAGISTAVGAIVAAVFALIVK